MSDPSLLRRIEKLERLVAGHTEAMRRIPPEQVVLSCLEAVYARLDEALTQDGEANATVLVVQPDGTYAASATVITVYGNILIKTGKQLVSGTKAVFVRGKFTKGRWQILQPDACVEDE